MTASPLTDTDAGRLAAAVLEEVEERLERAVEHALEGHVAELEGDDFAAAKADVLRRIGIILTYEN